MASRPVNRRYNATGEMTAKKTMPKISGVVMRLANNPKRIQIL
jgi:hypothetical protein